MCVFVEKAKRMLVKINMAHQGNGAPALQDDNNNVAAVVDTESDDDDASSQHPGVYAQAAAHLRALVPRRSRVHAAARRHT